MKRAFFLMLLVLFSAGTIFSQTTTPRPITLPTGELGFFLSREDMEVAVTTAEELNLLQKDYDTASSLYTEQLNLNQLLYIENNKLEMKISSLRILGWSLGGVAVALTGLLVWTLTR